VELVTARLLLREFTAEDLPAFTAYQSDPRYTEFVGPEESGPEFTRSLLELFMRWSTEQPRQNYQLAVVERTSSPELIGCAGVRCGGCEPGCAEFGLELAPRRWGRGFATEVARALLGFAFQDLGQHTVIAVSVTQNHRITRLLSKLGFRSTVSRPGPDWMRDRGFDETEWRLTADEWRATASRQGAAHG